MAHVSLVTDQGTREQARLVVIVACYAWDRVAGVSLGMRHSVQYVVMLWGFARRRLQLCSPRPVKPVS